ncbi:hypothetical protein N657DRAFT_711497 [Parathielavia appendiculata]|uniref:VWFA domain-containing protein n=1 Tax=Parathielavia appendiculata TaxID=2587402 RepID=A0AAN6TRL8_9PEZI|nr:hypothetical protein N657DRAFT_711497 [Parathielavia appendiculata]
MVVLLSPGRFGLILLSLISSFLVPSPGVLGQIPTYETETANFMTLPISSIHGFIPMPWACTFAPNPGTQTLLQFHANWHCTYPDTHAEFGRRFFGFHKQFGIGYNFYLASLGFPFVSTFYPAPLAPIPPSHVTRPQNAQCVGCTSLPNNFRAPPTGTLHLYPTVQALGQAIVGWHNNQHFHLSGGFGCGSQTTPARGDMNCFTTSPRDPVFWRYHSIFDEVQDAWHSLQDANVALVMDRSGSMGSTIPAFGITRLQAAKDAAQMFADMVDVASGHRLGLVTFSSGATTNLGLTGASTFSGALSSAMSSVSASGSTSIGAGLNAGQALVTGGTQPRKGIVLLTDGQENVAPMINSVNLGDTHLCAVGFASPSNLDGAKLRNLAEKQGGIWTSTQDPVELKKVFVQCFSNIFDAAQAIDPIDTLPYSSPISPPTIHGAMGDDTVIFVLGWADPKVKLQLSITTPSGGVVNLNAPNVQSRIGSTWHVVRIKLPYQGERDGDWSGRAVLQPVRGFVNGFSSLAVTGTDAGVQLIRNQLATLCTSGCGNVLFYQHTTNETSVSHGGGTSIYHEAVIAEMSRGTMGNATVAHQAADFSNLLSRSGGWDLVVYNAPGPGGSQTYDQAFASLLCAGRTKYIVSDARPVSSADAILRCAGATRGESVTAGTEKMYLSPGDSQLFPGELQLGNAVVRDARSYVVAGGSPQASYAGGLQGAASVAIGGGGSGSVQYFISVLAKSSVKLKPYTYINNTYVGEDLHPSFYVPAPYWPDCGFTHVYANVTITRPLSSLAAVRGDPKDDNAPDAMIPTETATYSLSDDGRSGDRVAGDHHFETALTGLTKYDGEYKLHARVRLCNQKACGKLDCIVREAEHVLDVLPKAAQAQTSVKVRQLEAAATSERKRSGKREKRATVVVTPRDEDGVALGRGHLEQIVARGVCGAVVEKFEEVSEDDEEEASYAATVSYPESGGSDSSCKRAGVAIHMYGRPKEAVVVDL